MTPSETGDGPGTARRRVVVLFGGRSAEHEISCISARSVIDALDPTKNEVVPVGITKQGRWRVLAGPPALPSETGKLPEVTDDAGPVARLAGDDVTSAMLVVADGVGETVDVVFPVLHGPFGEDGAVQGMLELAAIPYVGAGLVGSAIGMDKSMQKVIFTAAGLPVDPYETVREPEWHEDPEGVQARVAALGRPVFVKPATLGSSVGISRVGEGDELDPAVEEAFRYARKVVIERGIEPVREVEVAVLGNDDPVASVVGEIVPTGHPFYDYSAKYLDEDGARLVIPAELAPGLRERIQSMAITAFRSVECWGMARVDFFIAGGDRLVINEINTIPGFTSISMYPKLWEASGMSYPALIERLLELAVERHGLEWAKSTQVPELNEPA